MGQPDLVSIYFMDADGLSCREQEAICGYTRTSTLYDSGMFYIPVGMMAAQNPVYVAKAQEAYGLTAEQIQGLTILHSLNNFIPVTIGNILGGMVFVGIPCYFIYKKKWQKYHDDAKTA